MVETDNPLRGLTTVRLIAEKWGVSRQRVHQVLQASNVTVWTSEAFGRLGFVREVDVRKVERARDGRYPERDE